MVLNEKFINKLWFTTFTKKFLGVDNMKKITFGLMLLLMVVSVFAAIPNPLDLVSDSEVNGFDVVAISATVTPTFMQMSGRLKNVITNQYVGQGYEVNFYCYKNEISTLMGTVYTNEDGVFNFGPESLVSGKCNFGDEFYIVVPYEGENYKSQNIKLITFSQGSGSGVSTTSTSNDGKNGGSETSAEVPEFSTLTFGLAMLIAGIGFVLLRKN